ncbi:hypothetical protein BDFG_02363 [Blastomyces dermatitidis ATCC 26199]|nr:hypothetical protein BDFG_02363 [Blastomyces dermatitidis ATCC 26199]
MFNQEAPIKLPLLTNLKNAPSFSIITMSKLMFAQTPPCSPIDESAQRSPTLDGMYQHLVAQKELKDLLVEVIQEIRANPTAAEPNTDGASSGANKLSDSKPAVAALGSKFDFKRVEEIWDKMTLQYKTKEAVEEVLDELDQYAFVVELDLLYYFLPELETYRTNTAGTPGRQGQVNFLSLLIEFVLMTYQPTTERLASQLESGQAMWDILWAVFKPGSIIYTKWFWTEKPRCVVLNAIEEKTRFNGVEYHSLNCSYIDYDRKYHLEEVMVRQNLIKCWPEVLWTSRNTYLSLLWNCLLHEEETTYATVDDFGEIKWSSTLFGNLTIPDEQRSTLMALAKTQMGVTPALPFDDFVAGKGCDLNIRFVHSGPPGVGKTLTAEAMAENFEWPLYPIPAAQLVTQSDRLENNLTRIFQIAKCFDALLLLDEVDVLFLERRASINMSKDAIVTIFLRKLEYFQGIFFLTINRETEFDEAILSRIHLKIKYPNLS